LSDKICSRQEATYWFFPRSFTSLETETGGLLILDDINLLSTVFEKEDSVLLERNLKSYTKRDETLGRSYPYEQM